MRFDAGELSKGDSVGAILRGAVRPADDREALDNKRTWIESRIVSMI
jgi:hypothetical protein